MYSTAALTSASGAALPPLGGIAPLPLSALLTSVGRPCAIRGAQAALSPNFGAPATPAPWQATQVVSNKALPLPPAAAAGAAAVVVAAAAAAGAALGAAAA